MDAVFLDHNASAPVPEELLKEYSVLLKIGLASPSSLHSAGRAARRLVQQATEAAAAFVDCDPQLLFWTSGASESNTWALYSAVESALQRNPLRKPRVLVSDIEHESVLLAAASLGRKGVEVRRLPVSCEGVVSVEALERLLADDPVWDLISVMHANNETGVIQPVEELSALAARHGVPFHVDCAQTLGKLPISARGMGATYAVFSGHKLGAPKGVGFLAVGREGTRLFPLVHGRQQKGLRGGTENAAAVAMLGRILSEMAQGRLLLPPQLEAWRRDFEAELVRRIAGTRVHGMGAPRLPTTTHVGFEGADGDGILVNLDLEGICASSGSACSSGSVDPSHVLLAMGCDKAMARSSVRFSGGRGTTWEHYERVLDVLPEIVRRVRSD